MPGKTEIYHLTEAEQEWCHKFVKEVSDMDADFEKKKADGFVNTKANLLISQINKWMDEAVKLCQKKKK